MVGVRYSRLDKKSHILRFIDVQAGLTETAYNISESNNEMLSRVLSEEIQIETSNQPILLSETIKPTSKKTPQKWYIMKLKKNEYTHYPSYPPERSANKSTGLIIIGTINDLKNILFNFDNSRSTDNIIYPVLININQMLNERDFWFKDFAENHPKRITRMNTSAYFRNIEKNVNNSNIERIENMRRIQKIKEAKENSNLLRNVVNVALQETKRNANKKKKEAKENSNLLRNVVNVALQETKRNANSTKEKLSSKKGSKSPKIRRNLMNNIPFF